MTNLYALHSVIFMIAFVILFDGLHRRHRLFRSLNLFTSDELDRLQTIWAACREN
jgi:hypothetical protein